MEAPLEMSVPTTREQFKDFCLRKLGAPVIQINVDDEQIDDAIDEALSLFAEHHYNGTHKAYIGVQLSATDVANKYVTLPGNVIGVTKILDGWNGSSSADALFNVERDFVIREWNHYFQGGGLTTYYLMRLSLESLREWLQAKTFIRFNRYQGGRVYIDGPSTALREGKYLVFETQAVMDAEEFPEVWSDRWLQNYATALIKERWGSILTKFTGVQLVGGLTFSGDLIYQQAIDERMKLEEQLLTMYTAVPMDFYG